MFKAPKSRRPVSMMDADQGHEPPPVKRYRTSEDFLYFCTLILEHEGYELHKREEDPRRRNTSSPLGSTGSTGSLSNDSFKSFLSNKDDLESQDGKSASDIDTDDSYDQVTCYCGKPFAGRSMIECSSCLTWVHFKCANIKRTKIPENWYCERCTSSNAISTKSSSSRKRRKTPVRRPPQATMEQAA